MCRGPRPPASGSSRVPPPGGLGVILVTLVLPAPGAGGLDAHLDPGLQGGPGHSPPQPLGIAPHLAEASRPSRAPSRTALPWLDVHPDKGARALTGVRPTRDTGAGSVPLQFCPKAVVASHLLVHIPWRSSQGLEVGRLWPPRP